MHKSLIKNNFLAKNDKTFYSKSNVENLAQELRDLMRFCLIINNNSYYIFL